MVMSIEDYRLHMLGASVWTGEAVRAVMFRAGMNVKREAKKKAPKHVYKAHEIDVDVKTGRGVTTVTIETASPLGTIIEFGTPTLPGGRPYIGPACKAEAEVVERFLIAAVNRALR